MVSMLSVPTTIGVGPVYSMHIFNVDFRLIKRLPVSSCSEFGNLSQYCEDKCALYAIEVPYPGCC